MPNWTTEQQQAIDLENRNIIVSAGAGSGKTAVLTARVIRKLKKGIDINKLLVLTFTNEAAREMKNRIRNKIKEDSSLKEQLDFIDSAYITTFDSYALSLVKKYHYLLNISSNVSLIDSSIINIKKEEIINEIFDYMYLIKNPQFEKLINDFCIKDDENLKKNILGINNILDLKIDKVDYLNNYIKLFYNKNNIVNILNKYIELLKNEKEKINDELEELKIYTDGSYYEKVEDSLISLLNCKTYLDFKNCNINIPRMPSKSSNEAKSTIQAIKEIIKNINNLTFYDDETEIVNTITDTHDYVAIIIDIIKLLDKRINEYKQQNESYEFNDISKMAIQILQENNSIREEMKSFYNEILVDEYQDTNDIQETFISLIENNNIYMVGDIKQSIYRFRNANPEIFKNKYDKYSNNDGGIKIDLLKNFRSRNEVLNNINEIFNLIMDDNLGGAKYKETHQMLFGNNSYVEEGKIEENSNLEIYNYHYDDKEYSKEELEAFIIANDIRQKIDNNYKIFDKEQKLIRNIKYSDICIIMDRNIAFENYKKIFEYMKIPLVLYKDEILTNEINLYLIKNIMTIITKIKNNEIDKEFKYAFISIARSYLFSYADEYIFECFANNEFKNNEIYLKCSEIVDKLENLTNQELLNIIIKNFDIYEKIISIGDIEKNMIEIEYLQNIALNLSNLGYTPYMFLDYLNKMIESKNEIKYSLNTNADNNVKIMNIHKSKGLEFHICYFSGYYKQFNMFDLKERFMYDNKYGIITPYFKEGIGQTILKDLVKEKYLKDEISEKIRLLYVALTRCEEKMIIVTSLNEASNNKITDNRKLKYKSFLDILNSINLSLVNYIKDIDLKDINLSKDYLTIKNKNYVKYLKENDKKIELRKIDNNYEVIEEEKFSKSNKNILNEEIIENMEFGKYIHYLFEIIDFKNIDLDIDPFYKEKIIRFMNQDLLKNIATAKIYKEYEFLYEDTNKQYHGIIDLILEYDDHIDIIDYKLKEVADEAYKKQLTGYKKYLSSKTNKNINTYLYSIMDEKLIEL